MLTYSLPPLTPAVTMIELPFKSTDIAPHHATTFHYYYYHYYYCFARTSLNCLTEEMKEPVRNMPKAIIISISLITVIYTLTNTAYFAVLSEQEILNSDAIAVLFGNKLLSFLKWLMPLLVATSTMGGLNSSIFASSRILFAGSRSGQLPSALHMIHLDYLTPIPALIFLALISSVYLFTTEILVLINYCIFIEASFATLAVSSILVLRFKMPDLVRPLKIHWLVPISYLLFSSLLILLPIYTTPYETLIGCFILISGIPIYYLTAAWRLKPQGYQKTIDKFNLLIQKLTRSVTPTSDMDLLM